jgi:RHS repeat-associated protein
MPGRSDVYMSHRYGFNGKEMDNGVKGEGVQYDYGFRIYDARIARFLSVDPLTKSYPELTPYQFASNSPIAAIDLDGLEFYYAADGEYLGKYGSSTVMRVIAERDLINTTKSEFESIRIPNSEKGFFDHYLPSVSAQVYEATIDNEKELLKEWTIANRHKSYYRERGMSLYKGNLIKESGEPFEVFIKAKTVVERDISSIYSSSVELSNSKPMVTGLYIDDVFGWKRATTIHTHPNGSDKDFSDCSGDFTGCDIMFSTEHNIRLALAHYEDYWVKMFDIEIYNKTIKYNEAGTKLNHNEAKRAATRKYYDWIHPEVK